LFIFEEIRWKHSVQERAMRNNDRAENSENEGCSKVDGITLDADIAFFVLML
jgi:hypothetical protein